MGDSGWAGRLLSWGWRGVLLEAEISRVKYYIRGERREVLAHAEVREPGGRYRVEIGSYPTVSAARVACERDAQEWCRREREERSPTTTGLVDVRIAAGRRRAAKADKGRELPQTNCRPADAHEALDAALASWAGVVEDEG